MSRDDDTGAGSSGPDREALRAELGAWLAGHWDPQLALTEWRSCLVEAGWAAPSWPVRWYGRDLPAWADDLVTVELAALGAAGLPVGSGMRLAAPTILAHGTELVCERFLRPILTGEETWCQLFSEPGAGSDLAGLTTHAVLDGDRWIVNGQKVWTTSAHHADFGILLARTNWEAPKHRGITYFVLPMHQDGVEVRPMRQMNEYSSFNEVFLSDATIPREWVIGTVGDGWSVASTTLAVERGLGAEQRRERSQGVGRALAEAEHEADEYFETYKWYPQRFGRVDLVVDHAHAAGRAGDRVVRQEIAKLASIQRITDWTAARAEAARALGRPPGPWGSIGKLLLSRLTRQAALVHSLIGGVSAQVTGADGTFGGVIAEVLVSVPAQSIAGGTDEVQKNILGERVLGLAREPAPDKELPFRQLPRN